MNNNNNNNGAPNNYEVSKFCNNYDRKNSIGKFESNIFLILIEIKQLRIMETWHNIGKEDGIKNNYDCIDNIECDEIKKNN